MARIENTVFISYRRTNLPWALAIYQNLTAHGYDVFFDFESINSGDFEQVILGNIRARAHFIVILTPSMLERINEPNDWVRLEIETALDEKRNIIPLFFEGFNFSTSAIANQLNGQLLLLKKYSGFDVPANYFQEAMERLRIRYLNVALDAVIHPVPPSVQKQVQKQQAEASQAIDISDQQLNAQELFERAHKYWLDKKFNESIYYATEAILLKPEFAEAYNRRGTAKDDNKDFDGAIKDYTEAIRLKPDYAIAYNNRGLARQSKGDLDGAIQDYTRSIELKNSNLHFPYNNRGWALCDKGDLDSAIKDCTEAIRLKPDFAKAYNNRGNARKAKGDLDGAIKDYNEAIRLKPDYALAYRNRGVAWDNKGDEYSALADFEKSVELGDKAPTIPKRIQELRKRIK